MLKIDFIAFYSLSNSFVNLAIKDCCVLLLPGYSKLTEIASFQQANWNFPNLETVVSHSHKIRTM